MTKLPVVTPLQKDEVHAAIAKTNTFADALDQVFKKTVVAECLLMAALSHYDDATGLTSERLDAGGCPRHSPHGPFPTAVKSGGVIAAPLWPARQVIHALPAHPPVYSEIGISPSVAIGQ